MFDNANATRTPETEDAYLDKSAYLFKQYQSETDNDWKVSPILFCYWFWQKSILKNWSKGTVKSYRAALKFTMWKHDFTDAVKALEQLNISSYSSTGTSTSSKKQKSFPDEDLQKVELRINTKRKWDALLLKWIKAGIITGLRPEEWASAKLVEAVDDIPVLQWGDIEPSEDGTWLIVKNAKDTNNRANGRYRALELSGLTSNEFLTIKSMLEATQEPWFRDGRAFKGCRNRLSSITKEIWPRRKKRPSLYSGRHQFRANASSDNQSLEQIAALMGHATNETATKHYGYAKWGSGRQPVQPHPANVETVRCVYKSPSERHQNSPGF